jgi:two-component system sensor histidine kinase UhpB
MVMSLRLRVVYAIVLVFVLGSMTGVAVAGWQARQALREELGAALLGGRHTIADALEDLPASSHPARDLRRLVLAFDGDRHLTAVLHDTAGREVLRSRPLRARRAPAWFAAAFGFPVSAVRVATPLGGYRDLVLEPVFANDIGAVWAEFIDLATVLAASLAAGSLLVWLTVGRALRPLAHFTAAFRRIGSGDYEARVREEGPAELVRLGRGVNQMTERLGVMQARNLGLEEQLRTLQDEERADLARDLHDEIGPHLFAVKVDAAIIRRFAEEGASQKVIGQVGAIESAVAHMQNLVRDILGRLRPIQIVELGLAAAIAELVAFWRARRPEIDFELCLDRDESLPQILRETLYRIVQEGLNNAVRHGRPHKVRIEITPPSDGTVTAMIADDGAHAAMPGPAGFGLVGMRERVASVGGELSIDRGGAGRGWTITARLPLGDATFERDETAAT